MSFTASEKEEIRTVFDKFDADRNGHITAQEIGDVMKELGESVAGYQIRDMIKEVDIDENGTVEFEEFLTMYSKVKSNKQSFKLAEASEKAKKIVKVGGISEASAEGTQHAYGEEEKEAFTDWINFQLEADVDLKGRLPISEEGDFLFKAVDDGIVLCKLINSSIPNTVDERAINKSKKLNVYQTHENQTLALNSASAIGCNIVNIGADDLIKGRPHLVLGLLWQVIRIGLFAKINLQNCPGLARLLESGESIADLLALPPDQILLRWFNYHLAEAGQSRKVHNFGKDISDSECYSYLLKVAAVNHVGVGVSTSLYVFKTLEDVPGQVSNLSYNITSNTSAVIMWSEPEEPNGVITGYNIVYGVYEENNSTTVDVKELILTVGNLDSERPIEVSVSARTKIGKGKNVSKIFFTSEGAPMVKVQNIVTKWINDNSAVHVSWTPLTLHEARGFPLYVVTYWPSSLKRVSRDINSVTTTDSSVVIGGLDPTTSYSITVDVYTGNGTIKGSVTSDIQILMPPPNYDVIIIGTVVGSLVLIFIILILIITISAVVYCKKKHNIRGDTKVKEESNNQEGFQLEDNPAYGGVNIYEEIK